MTRWLDMLCPYPYACGLVSFQDPSPRYQEASRGVISKAGGICDRQGRCPYCHFAETGRRNEQFAEKLQLTGRWNVPAVYRTFSTMYLDNTQILEFGSTYLLMVIIVGLRTDGHDNGLPKLEFARTRAPPRIVTPVSETTKDALILCWPCRGPLCAPVAPVDCQLPLWKPIPMRRPLRSAVEVTRQIGSE